MANTEKYYSIARFITSSFGVYIYYKNKIKTLCQVSALLKGLRALTE